MSQIRKRRTLLHHGKVVAAPRMSLVFPSPFVQGESMTGFSVQPKLKLVQQVGVACNVPEHEVGSEVRLSPQHHSSADDCFSFLLLGTRKQVHPGRE